MNETFKKLELKPEHWSWLGENFKLGEVPAFRTEDLSAGLPSLALCVIPEHTTVLREGDPGRDIYVLFHGQVSVNKKKGMFGTVEVVRLTSGDYFGEIGFLGRASRSATVTTERLSKVFRINADEFKTLLDRHPELSVHLKKVAEGRLEKLAEVDR